MSRLHPAPVGLFASPPFIFRGEADGLWSGPLFQIVRDEVFFEKNWSFSPITFEDIFEPKANKVTPDWFLGVYQNPSREAHLWFSEPLFRIPVVAATRNGRAIREDEWQQDASGFIEKHDFCSSRVLGVRFTAQHPHMKIIEYCFDEHSPFPPKGMMDEDLVFGDSLMLANRFTTSQTDWKFPAHAIWDWAPFCISCRADVADGREEINDRIRSCLSSVSGMLDLLAHEVPVLALTRAGAVGCSHLIGER